MATPSKPVRHGREKPAPPAPQPLPARSPTAATPTSTTATTIPLVIRVVYEPLSSIAAVDVLLAYEDPANNYSEVGTLSFSAADGAQERVFTLLPPDPTRRTFRWTLRVVTSAGVTAESASITTADPLIRIDAAVQAALLR